MLRTALLMASLLLLSGGAYAAQSAIAITRSVYVERIEPDGRVLEPATRLRSGDRVVLVVRWDGADESRRVLLSSRVPATLVYEKSGLAPQAVSVDRGRSWGDLASLRTAGRAAHPRDVTDLRWAVPSASGTLTWSAVVR